NELDTYQGQFLETVSEHLDDQGLRRPLLAAQLSSAAHVVLTTQSACRPSLVSCLSLLEESLLSVTVAHSQSLRVLPSLSDVSKSGSHVTADVSGSVYHITVAMSGVSEAGTPVHTLAHGGSEAHGVLSGSTLSNEPKPLGQHRPPHPQSILSPGDLASSVTLVLTPSKVVGDISGTASAGSIQEYEEDEIEDGPVGYPIDGGDDGDDDDGDSSGYDADDEDKDEEEEEEHLTPADSAVVIPIDELASPPEGTEPIIPPPFTDTTTTGARITIRPQTSISLPPEAEV
nr:hypothetical protein [Tanacetum cinerariifolium]